MSFRALASLTADMPRRVRDMHAPGMRRRDQRARSGRAAWLVAVVVLVMLAAAALGVRSLLTDPNVSLLLSEGGGQWIGIGRPPEVMGTLDVESTCGFRRTFNIDAPVQSAKLTFRALKRADVILDGEPVLVSGPDETHWKDGIAGDLGPKLTPGRHELILVVRNAHGPACLLAYGDLPFLCTDAAWEASTDAKTWGPTRVLDAPWPSEMARQFKRADRSLLAVLPYLAPVFLAVFLWSLFRPRYTWLDRISISPSALRWILLAAWIALAANDIGKLPGNLGFDLVFHQDYVRHIVERGRVPLASDGWQMFQSPLYYLLSAPLYAFVSGQFGETAGLTSLRVLPLLAGVMQVELCYRAVRLVFPDRNDLQRFGLILGALLPMNLYISQFAGNEAPAGFFVGAVCVASLYVLRGSGAPSGWRLTWLGVALGLALLTKLSAVLIIVPVAVLLGVTYAGRSGFGRESLLRVGKSLALVLGVATVICGWYFVRNYVEMGRVAVAGWDPSRGMGWWQDPGYRTPTQLVAFGESLFYPVYSSFAGFWDGLYSSLWTDGFLSGKPDPRIAPPWNFDLLWALVWLSLLPTLAILIGAATAVFRPRAAARSGVSFAALSLAIYVAAMFLMFLQVPYFSVTKATYTAGLAPAYAVLAAAGFELLGRNRVLRALSEGLLASWAVAAYAAFFVI